MKEKLRGPKVEEVSVAVIQEQGDDGEPVFNVYLINHKTVALEQTLVTSTGYSTDGGVKTSTLRRLLGNVEPESSILIEPIIKEVFGLNNEYWVSFWIKNRLYDKKFIFLPESIDPKNYVIVPIILKKGVIIG